MAQSPSATPSSEPYRPYQLSSQPNKLASTPSVHHQDIQTLTQQLDAANEKIDHYTHLIVSLSTELKQYRDIICVPCKQKVLLAASRTTTSISQSDVTPTVPTAPKISSGPIGITPASPGSGSPVHILSVETGSEPSLPSPPARESSIEDTETRSDDSFTTAPQSIPEPSNETAPAVGVDYNFETEQALVLSMVDIFTFSAKVHCAKFSQDGNYFVVGLDNGETHFYDMNTMSQTVLVENDVSVFYSEAAAASKERLGILAVQFSPDNKYIAAGRSQDGQIKIWEMKRKRVVANLNGHTQTTNCIDFSPDGRLLASASYDNTVRIWCTRDGSLKHVFSITRDFNSVAFSPDGQCVAAGGDDEFLRIWDSRTGQLLKKWQIDTTRVWSVAFQPDGKRIASGGVDGTWTSWDLSTFRGRQLLRSSGHTVDKEEMECFTCKGQTHTIYCVSFSPDGRWVVTSSYDSTSRIWDAGTGLWECTLNGHTRAVWTADFSPTGDYLVTGSADGRVLLWKY